MARLQLLQVASFWRHQQQHDVMMMTTMTFASHNQPNFLPLALTSRGLRPQEQQLLLGCLSVINYGQSNSWLTSRGLKFFFSTTTTLTADESSRQEEGGAVEEEKKKLSSAGAGAEIITAAAHNKKGMMDGAPKYSVVRINSDGSWLSLSLTSAQLGIHPRDIDVLAGGKSFVPQRATIAVRNNKVVLRMENVRALVCQDFVLLFEARKPRISKRGVFGGGTSSLGKAPEEVMKKAREMFAASMAHQAMEPPGHVFDSMPFHLKMIECLLKETSNFFHQRVERLKVVVERMLEELTKDVNMGGLQRLLPLKRALTEVEHDVQDTHVAMDQVLSSDDLLQALCLENDELASPVAENSTHRETGEGGGSPNSNLRQATADMLLTYQREVDDSGGALEELRKHMEAAQEIWELGLDTTRNRIIQANLMMSMATLSMSLAAVVASFFGMNLPSGYEQHPSLFWWVVGGVTATSLSLSAGLLFICRVWPRIADQRRAQDLAGLNDLLHHFDDIDDIFQVVMDEARGKAVTQAEFQRIVKMHPSARFIRERELSLMFRLFDLNHNQVLEVNEFNLNRNRPPSSWMPT
ncbi:unnamed protein product [Sphagnum compactum]